MPEECGSVLADELALRSCMCSQLLGQGLDSMHYLGQAPCCTAQTQYAEGTASKLRNRYEVDAGKDVWSGCMQAALAHVLLSKTYLHCAKAPVHMQCTAKSKS